MSLERYEILGELSRDGAGALYSGWDRDRGDRVAVEFIDPELAAAPGFVSRLRLIAETLPHHRHPQVARIEDVGESPDGCPFVVTDLVEGRSLAELIAARAPLSVDDGIAILLQIVLGVEHLHERGLAPLALRPEGIVVDAAGHVTLTPACLLPAPAGAVRYRAPEEIGEESSGQQADVYRLGLIAYELFTGRPPFTATGEALAEAQLHAAPPPLVRFNPDVPGPATRAIQRSLAKKPTARPGGAAAFADVLLGADAAPKQPVTSSPGATVPAQGAATAPRAPRKSPRGLSLWYPQWLALAALAVILAAAFATVLVVRTQGRRQANVTAAGPAVAGAAAASAAPSTTPSAAAASAASSSSTVAAPGPTISELTVCSDVFACKQTNFVAGRGVAICFALTPASGGLSLAAAITAGDSQPATASAPGVIAHSAPISGNQQRSCYQVSLPTTLPPGPYTAWVLDGPSVLGRRAFTTVAP